MNVNLPLLKKIIKLHPQQLAERIVRLKPDMCNPQHFWLFTGNVPVLLVAHIDTVLRDEPVTIRQTGSILRAVKSPLGGDDRCGVYLSLQWLTKRKRPYVLLTNYEESGAIGAQAFMRSAGMSILDRIRLVVGLDRKGYNDYVTYSYEIDERIEEYLNRIGLIKTYGSFSDTTIIGDFYPYVSAINISVGYFYPHTNNEWIDLHALQACDYRLQQIINNPPVRYPMTLKTPDKWYEWEKSGDEFSTLR